MKNRRKNSVDLLGPFVGHVTSTSAKLWIYSENDSILYVKIEPGAKVERFVFHAGQYHTAVVEFNKLLPNTGYRYNIYLDDACTQPLPLQGLVAEELEFYTMPEIGDQEDYRLDFILMSCHDPDNAKGLRSDGYEVWRNIPNILEENSRDNQRIRFAVLCGDQIYADAWLHRIHRAKTLEKKIAIYIEVYKHFWSHIDYRRVLCKIPTYLMWDDHDIMDGWGSGEQYFTLDHKRFNRKSLRMFKAAREAYKVMQAQRNPSPLDIHSGFDSAFLVGRTAIVMLDLRSNRNVFYEEKYGRVWLPEQLQAVKKWVESVLPKIDTLFFVTSVVMAHGAPEIDNSVLKHWPILLAITNFMQKILGNPVIKWLSIFTYIFVLFGLYYWLNDIWSSLQMFLLYSLIIIGSLSTWLAYWLGSMLGDLRDDIYDSWSSSRNSKEAEKFLDYLFDVQNDEKSDIDVVILSGDIHAAGYASLYSCKSGHEKRAIIPHITSSPVANKPFHWLGEALYRAYSKTVPLGINNCYSAQISHHFTHRNIVVCSVRKREKGKRHYLKVKYYLEGFNEPQIMVFDLKDSSHKENLQWD